MAPNAERTPFHTWHTHTPPSWSSSKRKTTILVSKSSRLHGAVLGKIIGITVNQIQWLLQSLYNICTHIYISQLFQWQTCHYTPFWCASRLCVGSYSACTSHWCFRRVMCTHVARAQEKISLAVQWRTATALTWFALSSSYCWEASDGPGMSGQSCWTLEVERIAWKRTSFGF